MKLVRVWDIPAQDKKEHSGPIPGGTFWALYGGNDLYPSYAVSFADMAYLLKYGRLWIQDIANPGTWEEIVDSTSLPSFTPRWTDQYEEVSSNITVTPFMPEFYYVPTAFRGHRFIQRAANRAQWRQGMKVLHPI